MPNIISLYFIIYIFFLYAIYLSIYLLTIHDIKNQLNQFVFLVNIVMLYVYDK